MPAQFTLPPDTRAVGQGNPPADMNGVVDALTAMSAGLNVLNAAYSGGADPTGTADSTAALQAAVNAASPGQAACFTSGIYKISSPLTVPPGVTLCCPGSAGYDPGVWGDSKSGAVLQLTSGFSGSAALLFNDAAAAQTQGPSLLGMAIDGSAYTAAAVDGIRATGPVNATVLRDVLIYGMSGIGINFLQDSSATGQQYPYGWHCYHVKVDSCSEQGIFLQNHTDGVFTDVHVIGNSAHTSGHSWSIPAPCPNTTLIGCKAEWAGAGKDGFHLNGAWSSGTGSGGMSFVGCSTDRNDNHGFGCTATGTVPVVLSGCRFRRDGRNGGSGGGGFAGMCFNGSDIPVTITGCSVFPGVDDTGSGTTSPQYGLSLINSPANVTIGPGYLQGNTASRNWDNTGSTITFSDGITGASGTTASPVPDTSATRTAISSPVTVQNTGAETTLVSLTLPPGVLQAGSTYRINVMGSLQVQSTSGTLTFKPYMGGTAAAQTPQMGSVTTGTGPSAFWLEMFASVNTTGSGGTYVAHGRGEIENSTRVNLVTSSTATTAVNTVTANTVKLTATWATASTTNILTVSIASIERVA